MRRTILVLLLLAACDPAKPPPAAPKGRIVSLAVGPDEIVLSLVPKERIAGLSKYTRDPLFSHVASMAEGIPSLHHANADAILERSPEVVFLGSLASKETTQLLEKAKVRVIRIQAPKSLEEVKTSVRTVAREVGEADAGEALIRDLERKVRFLEEKKRTGLRALYLNPDNHTAGRETSVDLVLRLAGFENAAGDVTGNVQLPIEKVLAIDPDLIVFGSGVREIDRWTDTLRTDPRYAPLQAVKRQRIVTVPSKDLVTISHFLPDAAAELRTAVIAAGVFHE